MKILYLCPDSGIPVLGRKGAAVHVREMCAALRRAGHQVVLVAQTLNKSPWEKPAELDLPVLQVRPSSSATSAAQALKEFAGTLGREDSLPGELRRILYDRELSEELRRRFENNPPDFIYERASLYATAGATTARGLAVPLIVELNAPLAVEQTAYRATGWGTLAAQAERWTLSHADAVVVVSSELRDHAESLGLKAGKIHVMPNGVDPALFHPGAPDESVRRKLKLGSGPVLGFAGGLRPWHGVEILPDLLARLHERHGDVRLVIIGDGPLRGELQREFQRRGLTRNVIFAGLLAHEEVPAVLRELDVALAPYPKHDHEFYFSPLKLFEYMACGVPVVAAKVGQIAEVLRHGETGLLYPPGRLPALAAACERLLANAPLRRQLGAAAAKLVHEGFTWDGNAAKVVQLARKLKTARKT
jgi:glycosyltransferase involved in cell wall biosynthesis